MASFLASIFGTELDKVNCSFYFVRYDPSGQKRKKTKEKKKCMYELDCTDTQV
jgi:hypothetical protein